MRKSYEFLRKVARPFSYLAVVCLMFILSAFSCNQKGGSAPMPSTEYWTSPIMSPEQAVSLSKHDIVIADMENGINNRKSLEILKELNPEVKLICYSNPMEFWDYMPENRSVQNRWKNEAAKYSQWRLKAGDGSNGVFWPEMTMMNLSLVCPKAVTENGGESYGIFMARKLCTEVLSDPIWDGYFMDNCTPDIAWVQDGKSAFDIDGNGSSDGKNAIDQNWYQGVRNFLVNIKSNTREGFLLFGNKGTLAFADLLDGIMFENFPCDYLGSKENGGFNQCLKNAEAMKIAGVRYVIFQVKPQDAEFGLASALLFDNAYVAIGQDNPSISEILNIDPGKPTSDKVEMYNGTFYRAYEKVSIDIYPPSRLGKVEDMEAGLNPDTL